MAFSLYFSLYSFLYFGFFRYVILIRCFLAIKWESYVFHLYIDYTDVFTHQKKWWFWWFCLTRMPKWTWNWLNPNDTHAHLPNGIVGGKTRHMNKTHTNACYYSWHKCTLYNVDCLVIMPLKHKHWTSKQSF